MKKPAACLIMLIASLLPLAPAQAAMELFSRPLIPVNRDFTLPNGLRVILSEDHSTPVVSLAIIYKVGSRSEVPGKTGYAHLFEHMMFEGSENVHKGEYFSYIDAVGGDRNADTHDDFTQYYDTVPSNDAELILWLESDRLRSLNITRANLDNQLETVKEEKRENWDNEPYVIAEVKMQEKEFDNWHNAHSTIGSFADLNKASLQDLKGFFDTYYVPNNAAMAVVGDFNTDTMQQLVEKYFATIPRKAPPPVADVQEPIQMKAKYLHVTDKLATQPMVEMAWKIPEFRNPDYFALHVIEQLLDSGDSSRLFQSMVEGSKVAISVDARIDKTHGPSSFAAEAIYKPGHKPKEIESLVLNEIEKLKTQPVPEKELLKAKNQIIGDLFSQDDDEYGDDGETVEASVRRAQTLAEYALFYNDPDLLDQDLKAYMAVTDADIKRVAQKYLTEEGVTVLEVQPGNKASADEQQAATVPHHQKLR